MSTQELDELYFSWLYDQVAEPSVSDPTKTYWNILRILYKTEFIWIVPNDHNRLEDGKDLRIEFVDQSGLTAVDLDWMNLGCSVLELMIGLSRRLAFEGEGEPRDWFWHLMENLGLHLYNDRRRIPKTRVKEILDRLIWRNYHYDGVGGFFPLKNPYEDQRKVEIWYQMNAYLLELE